MNTPASDSDGLHQAERRKEAFLRWRKQTAWLLALSLTTGIVAGLATWLSQRPVDRDAIMVSAAMGVGLGVYFVGGMLGRIFMPMPETKCPRCEYDWRTSSSDDDWLTWNSCPECGSPMSHLRS